MILLSSLSILILLTFPFIYCSLKKSSLSRQSSSKKKTDSGSGSTDRSSNPDFAEKPQKTPLRRVIPSFPHTSDPAPPPPPPPAVTPRKLQFPITKQTASSSPEIVVKESEDVKKAAKQPEVVKKSGTARNHNREKEKEKKMQFSHELIPKDPKRKIPSKTGLVVNRSVYVGEKDEVDAKDQKSPMLERNRSLALMPTQMDSLRTTENSMKDTLARRNREKVKNGELNENSDDTYEDAPSLPKKVCPSYDQLNIETGESPRGKKERKEDS